MKVTSYGTALEDGILIAAPNDAEAYVMLPSPRLDIWNYQITNYCSHSMIRVVTVYDNCPRARSMDTHFCKQLLDTAVWVSAWINQNVIYK